MEAALLLSPPRPAGAEHGAAAAGRLGARRARGPSARPGRACGRDGTAPRAAERSSVSASAASGVGPSEREVSVDAPRPAPPALPGRATGSGSEGLGFGPRGHLAVRGPMSPARPLPVPSVARPSGAGRTLPASLRRGPGPGLASLAQDVLLRQRQGAGGLSGAVRADCPQPCPVPFAEAGQLRWALCKVQAECPELRARQGAGSARPDCWERGLMARDIRGARSQAGSFIELLSPQARPPPPPGSPRECWPAEFGAKAEATRRAGWGLSGRPGVSTLLGSYRVGHAAPVHPPPPAPLPGSRAEGVGWRDPWGRGAARRRPEGKTSRAR